MKKFTGMIIVVSLALLMSVMMPPARGQEAIGLPEKALSCCDIVDQVNSIVIIMDNQTRLTYINNFGRQFFGYKDGEVLGKSIVGTLVPETSTSGQDLAALIKDIPAHPERYIANENENMKNNGERVRVLWSNKAIYDDNGNVAGVLCVGNVLKGYV